MIDAIAVYIIHGFVVLGAVLLFFFAGPPATLCAALRAGCRPAGEKTTCLRLNSGCFNAGDAFVEVKALAAITPRHSGSPGAQKTAEHLLSRLRAMGMEAALDEFEEETPVGKIPFRNVIGILPGREADGRPVLAWIIVGAHYDTKSGVSGNFAGANDSGSGTGVLLELARVIKNSPCLPVNFLFAFFDGEECVSRYGKNDGLHGSRRLAAQLVRDGRSRKVRAVIILDMVGDRDLNITIPRNSALSLVSALFSAAEAEGTRAKFTLRSSEILDDHQPFLSAGMPAIDIIDFEYGSGPGKNDYWHTPEDTADKLSVQSLEVVGRTTVRMLDYLIQGVSPVVKRGKPFE
ncbi:MAG: M28 family peptidase [Kiritimatiellia bacterium]|nr:M28 family peptidase [Kiritimatiellia bacterium]